MTVADSIPSATKAAVRIHSADNVLVALRDLPSGEVVEGITLINPIPRGHKIAAKPVAADQYVIKYGYPIGVATRPISAGDHVHVHNVASSLRGGYSPMPGAPHRLSPSPSTLDRRVGDWTFEGFRRPDGRAGIRNEIWIVNTVGCVNRSSERIATAARDLVTPGSGIDGVHAFTHPYGCSQLGDDLQNTQKVLAGLVRHPNAAAVLILGLGCENNQMRLFLDELGDYDPNRVKFFNAQDVTDEIDEGTKAIAQLADYARQFKRETLPASDLALGMKCGGSDGLSGVTANPLVGRIADRVSAAGGTVLLTEVPEMFGAEDMLLERARDPQTHEAFIRMINDFREYFRKSGQPIDENPSPGNKDGGLTTNADKSLGCVQKGGTAPVCEILPYARAATPRLGGVALVNAPGNDAVSTTALTVAGAQMVLFTTGRGTPLGTAVPTLKISTNTAVADRKPTWIDFNAGLLADGAATMDELADRLWSLVLDTASGKTLAKNEQHGYREITIWKTGVTV